MVNDSEDVLVLDSEKTAIAYGKVKSFSLYRIFESLTLKFLSFMYVNECVMELPMEFVFQNSVQKYIES